MNDLLKLIKSTKEKTRLSGKQIAESLGNIFSR